MSIQQHLKNLNTWKRGFFILLFAFIYTMAEIIAWMAALFSLLIYCSQAKLKMAGRIDRGNLNLPACVFTLSFNKFRVQSERCRVNQVFLCKIHLQSSEHI
jgi:hypothetical protein